MHSDQEGIFFFCSFTFTVVIPACLVPDVGYGQVVDMDGKVIQTDYVEPSTKIGVKCPALDEIVPANNESKCLRSGFWDRGLYKCIKGNVC
jgi:hypothetical protein